MTRRRQYTRVRLDNIGEKLEELENKLEGKNVDVDNLHNQLKEVQLGYSHKKAADLQKEFAKMESRMEEMVLRTQKEVASLRSEMTMQIGAMQNQLEEVKAERNNQKHRHRRNVTSHHSLSLL